MTIATTAAAQTTQGNGATNQFPYAFKIPGASAADQTNVQVTVVDTTVSPALTTILAANQYSITGVGTAGGGAVTYPLSGPNPAAGVFVTVQRATPFVQSTQVPNGGNYNGSVLEAAYDYIVMLTQQLQQQVNRCFQVSVADSSGANPATAQDTAIRKNQNAAFDATGNLIAGGAVAGGIAINAAMTGLVQAASVSAAQTFLGMSAYFKTLLASVDAPTLRGLIGLVLATQAQLDAGAPAGLVPTNDQLIGRLMHGAGRLTLVGANLTFKPFNGSKVIVNSQVATIPDAGVTVTAAGQQAPLATTQRAITANVATLTIGAHAFVVGQQVGVKGVGGTGPYNGPKIVTAIDATHISYACVAANEGVTGDVNGTVTGVLYAYVTQAAGAVNALLLDPVGHATQAGTGVETKTGDVTKTLVGMVAIIAGPLFSDAQTQRFVLSWFNRRPITSGRNLTGTKTCGSANYIELDTTNGRLEFLCWGDETTDIKINGYAASAGTDYCLTAPGVDNAITQEDSFGAPFGTNGGSIGVSHSKIYSEGYHYSTILARISASTSSYLCPAGGALQDFTGTKVVTRG